NREDQHEARGNGRHAADQRQVVAQQHIGKQEWKDVGHGDQPIQREKSLQARWPVIGGDQRNAQGSAYQAQWQVFVLLGKQLGPDKVIAGQQDDTEQPDHGRVVARQMRAFDGGGPEMFDQSVKTGKRQGHALLPSSSVVFPNDAVKCAVGKGAVPVETWWSVLGYWRSNAS